MPRREQSVRSPLPAQPVTDRAAHYHLEVAPLEPRQLLGEQRHALAPRTGHARDVRAPEESRGAKRIVERGSADAAGWWVHGSGKADVAVRIELGDVDVPVGQRLEPYRAEERLLRLDQQDCLREARIVEAAAEVHARLDRECLELIDRQSWGALEVERVDDLSQVLADQHDVASPEGDAHPV